MEKTLSARIAERAQKPRASTRERNRAVFLALRAEIQQALADGWPVATIWRTLKEEQKVEFSYQAFRLYVKKLVGSSARASTTPPPLPQKSVPPKGTTGFTYNPIPNKEELI